MSRLLTSIAAAAVAVTAFSVTSTAMADGTIKGVVKFDGDMKKPKKIRIKGDQFCVTSHDKDNPLLSEKYIFNMDKGTLTNVVVYISSPVEGSFAPPKDPVQIDQVGCQYTPHVVTLMTGQLLEIKNSDATSHNLNLKSENNPGFNVGQPVQGMVYPATFSQPELAMPLKCDVHAWMNAYVAVFDHPFHAVTDEEGAFEIKGVPAGEYEVSVWHEFDVFGPKVETIKVTVPESGEATAEFTYHVKPKG